MIDQTPRTDQPIMHPDPVEMEKNDATASSPPRRPFSIGGLDMLKRKGVRRHLSREELEKRREEQSAIAAVAVALNTVVLSGFAVAMIYLSHGDPPLLVWSIGFLLCLLFYSWSKHINQFLLEPPLTHGKDPSILVLAYSLVVFFMSLLAAGGPFSSKRAGMAIVCLDVLLVAGYFGSCVANYMRATPSSSQDKKESFPVTVEQTI